METQKISAERRKKLRALAKRMNEQQRSPLPVNKALIDCFDVAITPEENEYLLKLGNEPYTYEELVALSGLPEESFRPFFDKMHKKGFLWPDYSEEGRERFTLAAIMVGWFEMFLSNGNEAPEQKEFARRFEKFMQSIKKMNLFPIRNLQNYRTRKHEKAPRRIAAAKKPREDTETVQIDINIPLEKPELAVYPTKTVFELIDKYGDQNKIALVHCFCRQWKKMVDEPCRFDLPYESCVALGDFTKHIVDTGIGRYISKENALELIQAVQEKGAVHQVFHSEDDIDKPEIAICNCCWDCCGVFGSYSRGIMPLRFKSYYTAKIPDGALCTGCGTCVKYCPTQALSIVNEKSHLHTEKCIGCGQCEIQCSEGIISLEYTERDVILPLMKKSEARIT